MVFIQIAKLLRLKILIGVGINWRSPMPMEYVMSLISKKAWRTKIFFQNKERKFTNSMLFLPFLVKCSKRYEIKGTTIFKYAKGDILFLCFICTIYQALYLYWSKLKFKQKKSRRRFDNSLFCNLFFISLKIFIFIFFTTQRVYFSSWFLLAICIKHMFHQFQGVHVPNQMLKHGIVVSRTGTGTSS